MGTSEYLVLYGVPTNPGKSTQSHNKDEEDPEARISLPLATDIIRITLPSIRWVAGPAYPFSIIVVHWVGVKFDVQRAYKRVF